MRSVKAKSYWPFAAIFLSLLVFYPEIFLVRAAALMGDHYEQHYPWAYFLHTAVKNFRLPFWTFGIHCGFPIAAESQIGIFYLPNLLLSLLLPFHGAYSYALIVHFLFSGCATYLYGRQMKLEPLPAFLGAFIFLFGAAYGGAYYNITSLKTIAWFPLVLFLFEKFLIKGRQRYLWGIAFSVGMSLVAGYLQVAVLTWFVFLIYAMLRILGFGEASSLSETVYRNKKRRDRQFLCLALAMGGASLIAAPQIYLTYVLALQSNRVDISEHYAYVGSLSPFSLSTLIDPVMQRIFRGNSLYGGLFSFFLILTAFYFPDIRKNHFFRIWFVITILAFLLAVGEWSPLYVALIKLTRFYSFRTPAKFLVFVCFGLAMLSAFGFQKLWQLTKNQITGVKKAARIYLWILGTAVTTASAAYYLFVHAREKILNLGEWYLRQFVYGRPGHPHSMDVYREKLSTYPDSFIAIFSFRDFPPAWTYLMVFSSIIFILLLWKPGINIRRWLIAGVIFLVIDLYGYAWFDIKRDFDSYEHANRTNAMVETLKSEKNNGNLGRLYGFRRNVDDGLPLVPSANMLYGIEDVGAYSPFILRRYYESIGQFGNVNDSNGAFSPSVLFFLDRLPLLSLLDVSHVLSREKIEGRHLQLVTEDFDSDTYLYKISGNHSRAHFTNRLKIFETWAELKEELMSPEFDPAGSLLLEKSELGKLTGQLPEELLKNSSTKNASIHQARHENESEIWEVDITEPGFFVVSNLMYPGWKATVNGKAVPILRAYGLFQAVWLSSAGHYTLHFNYCPLISAIKEQA